MKNLQNLTNEALIQHREDLVWQHSIALGAGQLKQFADLVSLANVEIARRAKHATGTVDADFTGRVHGAWAGFKAADGVFWANLDGTVEV